MGDPIKVLFVDDEPRLRLLWSKLIGSQQDLLCVGSLARADEVPEVVERERPAVVLMDLTMPGRDPIEVVAALGQGGSDVRVVVYSGRTEPESLRAAFDAGAWGFVDKLDPPMEIIETIRRVAAGEAVFPRGFSA